MNTPRFTWTGTEWLRGVLPPGPVNLEYFEPTMYTYRVLEDGEETWRGRAYDPSDALEKFFSIGDEEPSSLIRYTVEVWGTVKVSSSMSAPGWVSCS